MSIQYCEYHINFGVFISIKYSISLFRLYLFSPKTYPCETSVELRFLILNHLDIQYYKYFQRMKNEESFLQFGLNFQKIVFKKVICSRIVILVLKSDFSNTLRWHFIRVVLLFQQYTIFYSLHDVGEQTNQHWLSLSTQFYQKYAGQRCIYYVKCQKLYLSN